MASPERDGAQQPQLTTSASYRRRRWQLGALLFCAAGLVLALSLARSRLDDLLASHKRSQARQFVTAHQPDAARTALHEALRWKPSDGEARNLLGELDLQSERLEPAFLQFQSLTELQPENADGWLGLAHVRLAAGQPQEAEAALSRALELPPERVGVRTLRAELRYQLGRYRGALLDAGLAVHLDPKDAHAWLVLARATARVKGSAAGLEAAEKGVASAGPDPALVKELSLLRNGASSDVAHALRSSEGAADRAEKWPGTLGALMRTFVLALQEKNWSAAEQLAASAGQAYPSTFIGPWLEGVIELSRGQLAPAEKKLLEALAVAPRSHRAVTNLVAVWSKQKGPLYAGDRLLALAKADPGFDYPLAISARAYLEGDQPARAEAAARLSFTTLPGSVVPYREVAQLYLDLDRASDALDTCEQGLALFPTDVELQLQEARGGILLGDRERAIRSYEHLLSQGSDDQLAAAELAKLLLEARTDTASHERALDLVRGLALDAPVDPDVLGTMGWVYLKVANDSERAQQYLEAALKASPGDASLHFHLAVARKVQGTPELARAELRAALASGRPFPEEAEARRMLSELGGGKQ